MKHVLAQRYQARGDALTVLVLRGQPAQNVEKVRSLYGGAPLGFIAADEVTALEALTSGADEALIWPPHDDQSIHGFLDRTRLRATLRKEQELLRSSLVHNEKLAALGTLVAGVAHEISNPLTALQLSVEAFRGFLEPVLAGAQEVARLARRGAGATASEMDEVMQLSENGAPLTEGDELLGEIVHAVKSIANVVRDLRVFARSDSDSEAAQMVQVPNLVDQALRLVGREITSHGHIERDYGPDVPAIVAPPGKLTQVIINVLVNAAHAIREIERPVHRVRITTRTDGEYIAISVSDTGPGISPESLDRIFDPFFTTKRPGVGTGLGLPISRSIVQQLSGDLIVESVHGEGATFVILIPVPDEEMVRKSMDSLTPIAPFRRDKRPNVLLVDDDERILRAYARALAPTCNVLLASDGQEAIDLLRSGSPVDIIVTEMLMPEMDGEALHRWLRKERPELAERTVFVTAEATLIRYQSFLSSLQNPVLLKPVSTASLRDAINRVVEHEPAL